MNNHIVLIKKAGVYTPLFLEFSSKEQCSAAIAWQIRGGWPRSGYVLAVRDKGALYDIEDRGVPPIPLYLVNSGWTEEAYHLFMQNSRLLPEYFKTVCN